MVARLSACETLVPSLHLGRAEAHIIRLLDGTRTLEDIASNCETQLVDVLRLVLLLVTLRHAKVTSRDASARRLTAGVDSVRDAQRIREKLQQTRLSDYFDILGIAANASSYEVEQAASILQDAFHPSRFNQDLREQHAAEIAEIAEIIDDAREVLVDPSRRQAYAEHMV